MLFLGWLAVCFLVVGLINVYLRRFGLPKRKTQGSESKSTGYGSITFSGTGGLLHGTPFSRGAVGAGGESVQWINSILSWIYQSHNRVPDFLNSWLTSLTTEADHQAKEMQILFEGIHGSPPEFSNFRAESSSPEKVFTILTTVTLKDLTLQTSVLGKSTTTKATQTVKCDVYIQSLTGQVKSQAKLLQNELGLQLEFISDPTIKLQIRPTRVDCTIDNEAFEKVVRAAISKAPMRANWTSHSAGRPSHLRIVEPSNDERSPAKRLPPAAQLSPRSPATSSHSAFVDSYDVSPSSSSSAAFATPSPPTTVSASLIPERGHSLLTQQPEPTGFRGQQLQMTSGGQQGLQYSGTTHGQQQQVFGSVQGQPYSPPIQGQQQHPSLLQGNTFQGQGPLGGQQFTNALGQQSETHSLGPKLYIRVVKANGLIDIDFGNCSAFCRVHVDAPPQDFTTNVIRNTVNPYWDEQFISDFDRRTKQIQFEILDRDRQQGNDLLGKAIVLVDEIRRMPSSKQIIPLIGKPKSRTSTSGSVTVEFIFQESLESPASTSSSSNAPGTPFSLGQGSAASQKMSTTSITQLPSLARVPLIRKDDRTKVGSADYSPYGGRSSSGVLGAGASQLSAHNLALASSQPGGMKPQESPTVVVTGAESQRSATLQGSSARGTLGGVGNIEGKKKESFASTLKRTLGRVKIKPRSQSADRSTSRSLREGNLLRPPDQGSAMGQQSGQTTTQQQTNRNAGSASDLGGVVGVGSDGTIRTGRSNSFSSSLRRIFRRDKKDISREGSMTKPNVSSSSSPQYLGRGNGESGEALKAPSQGFFDRSRRQNTPVPSGDRFATGGGPDFPYSSSVPAPASPLQKT